MGDINKDIAMDIIYDIQNGAGISSYNFPDCMKGEMAKELWEDVKFKYGMEYGYILALMDCYDITSSDLGYRNNV